MPRLPGSQDVQRVEMRSDPGVQARSPVNDGMGEIGRALSGYAEEMQKRDDVINELRAESEYKAKVAEFKDKVMSKRDITSDETLQEFRGTLNGLLDETVRNHRGRPESQVRLHANLLRNADGEFSTLAAQSLTARKKMIGDEIGKVGSEAAKLGYDGAGVNLPQQISTAMESVERFRDAMTHADFNNAQAAMRSTITQNNLQGMLDKSLGDPRYLDVMEQMLATPEIRRDLGEESYRLVNNRLNAGRAATIKANADLVRDEMKEKSRREFELQKLEKEYGYKSALEAQKARAGGEGSLFDPKMAPRILSTGAHAYATGQLTPEQEAAYENAIRTNAKIIKDVNGFEVIEGVGVDNLRSIVDKPKRFDPRRVAAAQRTLGMAQHGGGGAAATPTKPVDTIMGLTEVVQRKGALVGFAGVASRAIEGFPIGNPEAVTAAARTRIRGAREQMMFMAKNSDDKVLRPMYDQLAKAFDYDPDAVLSSPNKLQETQRGGYELVWSTEKMLERQYRNAPTQKDKNEIRARINETSSLRYEFAPTAATIDEVERNIGTFVRGVPVFVEAEGRFIRPEKVWEGMQAEKQGSTKPTGDIGVASSAEESVTARKESRLKAIEARLAAGESNTWKMNEPGWKALARRVSPGEKRTLEAEADRLRKELGQ